MQNTPKFRKAPKAHSLPPKLAIIKQKKPFGLEPIPFDERLPYSLMPPYRKYPPPDYSANEG